MTLCAACGNIKTYGETPQVGAVGRVAVQDDSPRHPLMLLRLTRIRGVVGSNPTRLPSNCAAVSDSRSLAIVISNLSCRIADTNADLRWPWMIEESAVNYARSAVANGSL